VDAIFAFIVAAWISFVGSILLGLVNVAVIETSISKGTRHGIWLAIGGVLPEIPYTLLAIYGTSYVDLLKEYQTVIGIVIGFVFIGLGAMYLIKKVKNHIHTEGIEKQTSLKKSFAKGLFLAFANPQLIFFWSAILLLLHTGSFSFGANNSVLIDFNASGWVSPKISFAIGATIGALCILLIYVSLANKYREKLLDIIGDRLSKIVGLIFLVLGLFAIFKNVI
jgi:threonine/homoserine/homoserine lactone efflux protein